MRALALIAALTLAAPAVAQTDYYPKMRCAACSLLPAGATGSDLTLSGTFTASGTGIGFTSASASGTCAFAASNEGARTCFGPDTYGVEAGTALNLSASGGVWALTGRFISRNAGGGFSFGDVGNEYFGMVGGSSEVDVANGGFLSLLTNAGTTGSGTGYTTNSTGYATHRINKITITRAALTNAATTEDETPWTLAAKTRVVRIIVDVTQAFDDGAGPISAVTITCGPSAGSAAYVASSSVFTINTIGDVAAEIGAGLTSATIADIPSFSATTAISCRFTSTGGNLSTLTTGSATFYIVIEVYP